MIFLAKGEDQVTEYNLDEFRLYKIIRSVSE